QPDRQSAGEHDHRDGAYRRRPDRGSGVCQRRDAVGLCPGAGAVRGDPGAEPGVGDHDSPLSGKVPGQQSLSRGVTGMTQAFDHIEAQLRRRHRKTRRLKALSMGALGLAGLFLVLFFTDMLIKGLPAFKQAQIQVEVDYSEQASQLPLAAVSEAVRPLVSRGYLRLIPSRMRDDPTLQGTTRSEWVLAN